MPIPLLTVENLSVRFKTPDQVINAVNGVSFSLNTGETLGIVGESGSGKTVTVLSILGLIPKPPGEITGGRALFEGQDLLPLSTEALRSIRGQEISMVFQDPMTSLNPVMKVGEQLREALWTHEPSESKSSHRRRGIELLDMVGIPQPERRYNQFPHEYSGGMRQRAMIAMAMANRPKLLIADEPTTALDVTIQAQVIETLKAAREEMGAASILITHDLGLVSQIADRVIVMYAGRIVEEGRIGDIFSRPRHPYTIGLLASIPSIKQKRTKLYSIPGQPPDMANVPPGCPFHPRCAIGGERSVCRSDSPRLLEVGAAQQAACHFTEEAASWLTERAT